MIPEFFTGRGPNTRELMTVSRGTTEIMQKPRVSSSETITTPRMGRQTREESCGEETTLREAVTLVEEGRWNKAGWERSFGKYIVLTFLPLSGSSGVSAMARTYWNPEGKEPYG